MTQAEIDVLETYNAELPPPTVTFCGYEVEEAVAIIRRAEDAGLADRSKRLWDDRG